MEGLSGTEKGVKRGDERMKGSKRLRWWVSCDSKWSSGRGMQQHLENPEPSQARRAWPQGPAGLADLCRVPWCQTMSSPLGRCSALVRDCNLYG